MLSTCVGMLVTFAEIIAYVSLMGMFAEPKEWYRKYKIIYVILSAIGFYSISILMDEYVFVKFVIMILLFTFIVKVAMKVKIYEVCALTVMYLNILTIVEYLAAILILKLELHKYVSEQWQNDILQLQVVLFEVIILTIMTIICIKNKGRLKDAMTLLETRDWIGIFVIALISLTILSISVKESGMQDANQMNVFVVLIGFAVAFLDAAIIHLFVQSTKRQKHILENEAVLNRVKNETMLYRSITDNMEKQSRRIHEFNNRMTAIKSMLDQGKIEELQQYVDSIETKIKEYPQIFNTKNVIVDAIMTAKYEEMLNNNILFVHKFSELAEVKIADDDLVILLSNLLNNAIEACMNAEKRTIKMKFVVEDKHVVLSVTNTFGSMPAEIDGELVTTKDNESGNHGIGLKNVKEIVEKYDGIYTVNFDEEWFFVAILIPR